MAKEKRSSKDMNYMTKAKGKEEALETVFAQIKKQYGEGAIMKLGSQTVTDVDVIPTGSILVDMALGIGGIPKGRIIEIYGPESSGKTTLSLHIIAQAQKMGGTVAFIDAEHALDPQYAAHLGVDIDELIISQPDNGEQALEITEALARSGAVDAIVIDSVAALVPKGEIEATMGDAIVGLQARLMSQALRKLTGIISKSNTATIFINQLREKVGVMFGSPETTTGGKALKFYSSIRIDVRRGEPIKSGTEIIGNHTKIKIVKNKMAPPFKEAHCDILYGEGISAEGEILDLAVEDGLIKKSGSWFSYDGAKIGQGRDAARQFLKDNPEIFDHLNTTLREKYLTKKKEDDEQPGVEVIDQILENSKNEKEEE